MLLLSAMPNRLQDLAPKNSVDVKFDHGLNQALLGGTLKNTACF